MRLLIAIPTHNEELVIETTIRSVAEAFPRLLSEHAWRVIVADNASTDRTRAIVESLRADHPWLSLWSTEEKGRGNALKQVWQSEPADAYLYMDADLATSLEDLPALVDALQDADLATGSRLVEAAATQRSWFRETVSRAYSAIVRRMIRVPVRDLQCGFKAIRHDASRATLPLTRHPGWFFDTELIALAHAKGFRVAEIPVRWKESRNDQRKSTVRVFRTATDNLWHLFHLRKRLRRDVLE